MDKAWPLYYYWRCTPRLAVLLTARAYCATELAWTKSWIHLLFTFLWEHLVMIRVFADIVKLNSTQYRVEFWIQDFYFHHGRVNVLGGDVAFSNFRHLLTLLMNCTRRKWPHCPVISLWLFMAPFIIFSYRNIKVIFAQMYLFPTGKFCIFFHIVHCAGWGHLGRLAGSPTNEQASTKMKMCHSPHTMT